MIQQLWTKYRRTGSVNDIQRRPRSRVTTPQQDRQIYLTHLRDRFLPAARTARVTFGIHNRPIHQQTVRNRLKEHRLQTLRARNVPILTARHRRERLQWARRHARFTRADWANILFVDEVRFNLRGSDGRARVYRSESERDADVCLQEVDQYGEDLL